MTVINVKNIFMLSERIIFNESVQFQLAKKTQKNRKNAVWTLFVLFN